MILAEVSHPPTKFVRIETFRCGPDARKWIDFVIKTDVGIQSYRNNCLITITDIPSNACLVSTSYLWWK